jgi:hypothetical protein
MNEAEARSHDQAEVTLAQIGRLPPDEVRAIFKRVALSPEKIMAHAGAEYKWLVTFAWAVTKADDDNFRFLWPAACVFIAKYRLTERLPW